MNIFMSLQLSKLSCTLTCIQLAGAFPSIFELLGNMALSAACSNRPWNRNIKWSVRLKWLCLSSVTVPWRTLRCHAIGCHRTGDCLPVALHTVNEVVCGGVAAQGHVCVVDLVLGEDAFHRFSIHLSLRALHGRGDRFQHTAPQARTIRLF